MKLNDKLPEDAMLKAIIVELRKLKQSQKLLAKLFNPRTYNDFSDTLSNDK